MVAISAGDLTRGRVSGGRPYTWHIFGGRLLTRLQADTLHVAVNWRETSCTLHVRNVADSGDFDVSQTDPSSLASSFLCELQQPAGGMKSAAAEHWPCESHSNNQYQYQPYYRLKFTPIINKMAWGDEAEDPSPEEPFEPAPAGHGGGGGSGSGERPRLNLMPRGATAAGVSAGAAAGGGSSKSNPFGAAKPREEGKHILIWRARDG